jgi:hypothetical protein
MSEITLTTGFDDCVLEIVDSSGESICSFEGESLKLILEASVKSFFDSVIDSIPEPSNYDPDKDLARSDESQLAALRAIHDLTIQNGYAPSVRDVGEAIGRSSSSTAQRIIDYLKRRGWIDYAPKIARSMKITDKGMKVLKEQR